MRERGMWTTNNGEIVFKSKTCQFNKVVKPTMIIDMMSGTLHKFGEQDWILSHHRHLSSQYGEDIFMYVDFPQNWNNEDIVTLANFACSAHDADILSRLFSHTAQLQFVREYILDLRAKGF